MDNVPPEEALTIGLIVAQFLIHAHRWAKAIDLYSQCTVLLKYLPFIEITSFPFMGQAVHQRIKLMHLFKRGADYIVKRGLESYDFGQLKESIKYLEKALFIHKQIGCRSGEAWSHCHLGRSLFIVCQYDRTVEHYEKALVIREITGLERQQL